MCTLVLAWQAFADTPVAVAANRDELLDRPSEPPSVVGTDPRVVAPRDGEAGGTWIGYNEGGTLVAVTNRWVDADLPRGESRGLLVRDALRHRSAEDAARYVERSVGREDYEGFNLVVADADAAILLEWDGHLSVRNLDPGVHVVVNVGADGGYAIPRRRSAAAEEQAGNAERARTALRPEPGERAGEWIERAADVIADHDYGVCVHRDAFGTRSSSLITIGPEGGTYRFAGGPPCEASYRPVGIDL